jgi:mannosyltransferase OCH1-like enzyme
MIKEISKYIDVRNDVPIKNNVIILNNNLDFHIVIYYLDDYLCKIIIRRLDIYSGWEEDLKIMLDTEVINIGISSDNYLILDNYITTTKLIKENLNYEQKIPKKIIQTYISNKFDNPCQYNSIMTFIELNPEYEYILFDDNDCRDYIKFHYDNEILEAYDMLVPGAYKADLFRYCYLNKEGGCYFDCKMILRVPIRNFINKYVDLQVCKDRPNKALYNAIIMSSSNKLDEVIEKCIFNIFNKKIFNDTLKITGPTLLYESLENTIKSIDLKHIDTNNVNKYMNQSVIFILTKKIIITNNCPNYYENYKSGTHYSDLCRNKLVYYQDLQIIDNKKIYLYPSKTKHQFIFNIIENKLVIERVDKNEGWNILHKVKLIDNITNKEYYYDIFPSENNVSFIILE